MGYQAKGKTSNILTVYESKPDGNGPFPTIIVFMHAYGIDDPMKKVCDDLATEGFYTIMADAYLNGTYQFQSRNEKAIFESLHLLRHWATENSLINPDKMGLIGFCMGGRHAYLTNAFVDDYKAVVSYYGFPQRGEDDDHIPQNLIDKFSGPVLSIFGSEDKGIPMEAVNAYQEVSEAEGKPHISIVYQGAGHGFLNPNSPNHHAEASEDAWGRTISHFKKYLS